MKKTKAENKSHGKRSPPKKAGAYSGGGRHAEWRNSKIKSSKACNLCRVVQKGEDVLFENKSAVCILNAHPLVKGHVMVMPKRHVTSISQLTPSEKKDFIEMVAKVNKLLLKYEEVNKMKRSVFIFMKEGDLGVAKSEEHTHLHLLPLVVYIRELIAGYYKIPPKKRATKKFNREVKKELAEIAEKFNL